MPSRHCGGQPFRANSASSAAAASPAPATTPRWSSAGKRGWFGIAPVGASERLSARIARISSPRVRMAAPPRRSTPCRFIQAC